MADYHQQALELAANDDWDGAHRLIQRFEDPLACQIHGYLHRVEGDNGNAAYWYHRASLDLPANSLPEEFERLKQLSQ